MKLPTLMLKELIEMIEILQFRCYFKFGIIWNGFAQINVDKLNYYDNFQYCCYLLQEKQGRKRHCAVSMLRLGRFKKFQSCVQILTTFFIDYVRIGKVLIQG